MTHPESATASRLDQLYRVHDDEPEAVAKALHAMGRDGVDPSDHARFAWLVNHVIGEKQAAWADALALLDAALAHSSEPGALRHHGVAALFAGAPVQALALQAKLATLTQADPVVAACAVQLGALQFAPADEAPLRLAAAFQALLPVLDPLLTRLGRLDTLVAASLNNVTSRLLETADAPTGDPLYAAALRDGAQLARRAWYAAGTWLQRERADYLVALCANKLQDFGAAKQAALAGLQTIDAHGPEDVDRAFLLLELARAHRGLGEAVQGEQARAAALQLAEGFDDAGLREWFDACAAA